MDQVFIYMDIYRCGKIARVAVSSFLKFYQDSNIVLHLFGVSQDFLWFENFKHSKNLSFDDISDDKLMLERWNIHGHFGTAHLWSKLIIERKEKFLLHLDSDVIFRGPALDPLLEKVSSGYDLVGSPRNYRHNLNNRDDVRHLNDLVQTAIFAFNREKINQHDFEELVQMSRGFYNPLGHPVIDFFDPVMFEILKNGGKIFYLDTEDYGGTHLSGHRKNSFGELNEYFDMGRLFIHFASVGSGLKYFFDPFSRFFTPKSYIEHGLERYWLFCKLFYGQDLKSITPNRAADIEKNYHHIICEGLKLNEINNISFSRLDKMNEMNLIELIYGSKTLLVEILKKVKKKLWK